MGITLFDTSFGSVGGQPAHHGPRYLKGLTGNTATEDLVCIFEDMGVDTGVSVDGVIHTAAIVEEVCGEKLYGKVTRGGGRTTRPRDEELAYDDMWEGKEFPPAFFHIDPEASAKYMEVMGDYDPLYTDDGLAEECGLGGAIVPPALAAIFLRESYLVGKKMPQGGVMAKMEIESVAPLRLKDALISYSKVLEKYERNERKYVAIEIETYNRAQELVVRGKITGIWPH
jgi:acyl dehydratase